MERDFPMFVGGEGSGTVFSSAMTGFTQISDDASYINAIYPGINAQSLFPSLDQYSFASSSSALPPIPKSDPVTFGFFGPDFPAIHGEQQLTFTVPKEEPLNEINDVSTEPFNFLSTISDPIPSFSDSGFLQLPNLRSLDDSGLGESSQKRSRPLSEEYDLESIVRNYFQRSPEIPIPPSLAMDMPRLRRQKISDKTRSLQKLLPWDKKMDMATMLEETYKYVKFLQAQVSVLQSMPRDSSGFATQNPSNLNLFGALGRLNRQQLLEVVLNSPVAQTVLYSRGCCVYSLEQLVLLKKIAARKALYQEMLLNPFLLS